MGWLLLFVLFVSPVALFICCFAWCWFKHDRIVKALDRDYEYAFSEEEE